MALPGKSYFFLSFGFGICKKNPVIPKYPVTDDIHVSIIEGCSAININTKVAAALACVCKDSLD